MSTTPTAWVVVGVSRNKARWVYCFVSAYEAVDFIDKANALKTDATQPQYIRYQAAAIDWNYYPCDLDNAHTQFKDFLDILRN